jgi:hypothetical protein
VAQVQKAWIKGREVIVAASALRVTARSPLDLVPEPTRVTSSDLAMAARSHEGWTILTRTSHDGHEPMARCVLEENAKDVGIYYTHLMRNGGDVRVGRQ